MYRLSVALLLLGLSARAQTPVPSDWYFTPPDFVREELTRERASALEIEDLMVRHARALDRLTEKGALKSRGDWSLSALTLDLGLSLQGVLGVIVVKGSAAASARWRPAIARGKTEDADTVPTLSVSAEPDR
jgi:hypothetical protein